MAERVVRAHPDRLNDEALVGAAQAGDRAALDALLRRHHDRVVAICRQLCRDRSDADDAAQEALIAIVRGLDRFDGRSRFSTWAYRVTTNCCMDELRRRRRRPEPVDDAARLELGADELSRAQEPEWRDRILGAVRAAGYTHVTIDPRGYRMGSLNEGIPLRAV